MKQIYQKIKDWYNQNLDTYIKSGDVLMEDKLDKFLKYVPANGKILDIGSGTGRDVNYFNQKNYQGFGIDFSHKMVSFARKILNLDRIFLMNMVDLKFENNYFDGVWDSSSLFTHLQTEEMRKALNEVQRVLKFDGVFGIIAMKKGVNEKNNETEDYVFNKFFLEEILGYLTVTKLIPFYVDTFVAHDKEWFYILAKNKK